MGTIPRLRAIWIAAPLLLAAACAQQVDGPPPTTAASQQDAAPAAPEASATPSPSLADALSPKPTTPPATASPDTSGRPYTPLGPPPKLDTASATVPLDSVVFDTFRGGYIPLPQASDTVIESLRDAIKPIYEPAYESVDGGSWLEDACGSGICVRQRILRLPRADAELARDR